MLHSYVIVIKSVAVFSLSVQKVDGVPENEKYTLHVDTLHLVSEHVCVNSGIEELVREFRTDLEDSAKIDIFKILSISANSTFSQPLLLLSPLSQPPKEDRLSKSCFPPQFPPQKKPCKGR